MPLLGSGDTLAAGALIRVVIEHAVLAEWVKVDLDARGMTHSSLRFRIFDLCSCTLIGQPSGAAPRAGESTTEPRCRAAMPTKSAVCTNWNRMDSDMLKFGVCRGWGCWGDWRVLLDQ